MTIYSRTETRNFGGWLGSSTYILIVFANSSRGHNYEEVDVFQ